MMTVVPLKKSYKKLVVDTVTKNKAPGVIREFNTYIKDWEIDRLKGKIQRSSTKFLAKYVSLYIYDEDDKKRYTTDHEDITFQEFSMVVDWSS